MSQTITDYNNPITPDFSPSINFDASENDNFAALLDGIACYIEPDSLIKGTITKITKDFVFIDIGFKSQGQVAYSEFLTPQGDFEYKLEDEVEVFLENLENQEGRVVLSKDKANQLKIWENIKLLYENGETISGKIVAKVKGGLSVDIGIKGFLPGSQVDLKPTKDLDQFIGVSFDLKVLKYDKKRSNVVLSRRAVLEVNREGLRKETISQLEVGAMMKGYVKNITDYGLFVDLGGIDGLLHITDMTWGRINHPSDLYQLGDEIEVTVLSFDKETQRVSLGLKQKEQDPWVDLNKRYNLKDKITGKVVNITNYGAFVEIVSGIEGLIHISEMSWTKKIKYPSSFLKLGDTVEAAIKDIDFERKRISLSIRDVQHNPWSDMADRYPIGTEIKGIVRNITDFGIFVGIEEGIDGLVHNSDVSWSLRNKNNLFESYEKDQEIKVKLLNIDVSKGRLSLGIKQLTDDPWKNIDKELRPDDEIKGKVVHITDFGVFVELKEGLEGLIHLSEMDQSITKKQIMDKFPIGKAIVTKVINIDVIAKRLALSPVEGVELEQDESYEKQVALDAKSTDDKLEKSSVEGAELEGAGLEEKSADGDSNDKSSASSKIDDSDKAKDEKSSASSKTDDSAKAEDKKASASSKTDDSDKAKDKKASASSKTDDSAKAKDKKASASSKTDDSAKAKDEKASASSKTDDSAKAKDKKASASSKTDDPEKAE
ncbi:MAG: 30S ribosomal protein S1 [SAR324 cluster bacterium]|nr:30S ribosomal protein S1 [SAR324 cluster bacterium]